MAGYYWVPSSRGAPFPPNAVQGGTDADGSPIYVGLASFQGDELPVKVVPARNVAYVGWNGDEHGVRDYKVLCENRVQWVRSRDGQVPPNAIPCGRTSSGETLYVGRARHRNAEIVGKIHPSHRCIYIPFGRKEHPYNEYEVLVSGSCC